ncbi:MAG: hypothetical protein K0Q48_1488 [Bacillota bacterium]|jgi:hypothetical protein|nr:hypothetical protein [Bacillota bacterium]
MEVFNREWAVIKRSVCVNIAYFESENSLSDFIKVMEDPSLCDRLVPKEEGYSIGDNYVDGSWSKPKSYLTSPTELRKQAYQTLLTKNDDTDLILWDGKAITVDQANKIYIEYGAEGNFKAAEIRAMIVVAKTYIRELYPDC